MNGYGTTLEVLPFSKDYELFYIGRGMYEYIYSGVGMYNKKCMRTYSYSWLQASYNITQAFLCSISHKCSIYMTCRPIGMRKLIQVRIRHQYVACTESLPGHRHYIRGLVEAGQGIK